MIACCKLQYTDQSADKNLCGCWCVCVCHVHKPMLMIREIRQDGKMVKMSLILISQPEFAEYCSKCLKESPQTTVPKPHFLFKFASVPLAPPGSVLSHRRLFKKLKHDTEIFCSLSKEYLFTTALTSTLQSALCHSFEQ